MWWRQSFKESVDTNTDSPRESSKNAKCSTSLRSFGGVHILESIEVSVFFFFVLRHLSTAAFHSKVFVLAVPPFFSFYNLHLFQ